MPNNVDPVEKFDYKQENSTESDQSLGGGSPNSGRIMTLQKAVDMGEYEAEHLAVYPEWHDLTPNIQLEFIRQGLKNRERLLNVQWAELSNVQNFSNKPELLVAMRNIEKQRDAVLKDRERIYLEYSEKLVKLITG